MSSSLEKMTTELDPEHRKEPLSKTFFRHMRDLAAYMQEFGAGHTVIARANVGIARSPKLLRLHGDKSRPVGISRASRKRRQALKLDVEPQIEPQFEGIYGNFPKGTNRADYLHVGLVLSDGELGRPRTAPFSYILQCLPSDMGHSLNDPQSTRRTARNAYMILVEIVLRALRHQWIARHPSKIFSTAGDNGSQLLPLL